MRNRAPDNKRFSFIVFGLITGIMVSVSYLAANSVQVQAAAGSAGSGVSGGDPRYRFRTNYGWGWYIYEPGVSEPNAIFGTDWSTITNRCSNYKYIIGFTLRNSIGQHAIWGVQEISNSPNQPTFSNYQGNSGGRWVPWSTAYNNYNSLPPSDRDGTNWVEMGPKSTTASWYCYEAKSNWTTTGETTVAVNGLANATTANVGQRIAWTHRVTNHGQTKTGPISATSVISGFDFAGWNEDFAHPSVEIPVGESRTFGSRAVYDVRPQDVGKTLCQRLRWTPVGSGNSGASETANRCVQVPYNYNLTPVVTLNPGGVVENGSSLNTTGTVRNNGSTYSRPETRWQLTRFVLAPNHDINKSSKTSRLDPCADYGRLPYVGNCEAKGSGQGVIQNGNSVKTLINNEEVDSLDVGTQICYVMSVQPYSHSSNDWRHSDVQCAVVGKKPSVQIWGGDVRVGASYNGASSLVSSIIAPFRTINGKTYGSWGEYGMLAPLNGSIYSSSGGTASGQGAPQIGGYNINTNPLSFSNITTASYGGLAGWGGTSAVPSVASYSYPNLGGVKNHTAANFDLGSMPSGRYNLTSNGRITVSGSNNGKTLILFARGNVYIDSDIRLPDNFNGRDVPQTVIIARNIIVGQNVKQIDAWLIAVPDSNPGRNGAVFTCVDQSSGVNKYAELTNIYDELSSTVCNEPLKINGPVIAKELWLRRTAGSEKDTPYDPAEIINLRPDAYLWAVDQAIDSGEINTGVTYELPPRF